jgi:sugar phosphate permease
MAGRRWMMWGIPALLFLIGFFHRVAPGVMARELMQAFDATGTLIGLLSATYFYAYAGLMIPGGVLIDALGVRRVVAAGGAVMALGTLVMGAAGSLPLLFAGRLLVGLGATVTFVGTLKIAAAWFPASHFGSLSAITATVGILGALTATAPLAVLVGLAGWRGALAVVAGVTLVGAVVCAVLVRDHPDDAGPSVARPAWREIIAGTLTVLRNRHTWPPFLGFFCLYSAMGNLMLWVVPYLRDVYRLSSTEAALYAMAPNLALLVTGPLTGFASDRLLHRRKAPYTALTCAQVVLWGALVATLGALPLWGLYLLFLALGAVGGAFVLTWPIGREVNPPALAGIAVAVVNLGGFLGAALTQGPLGAVLDARWAGAMVGGARSYPLDAYRASFTVCTALVLASAVISLAMRETGARNVHAELVARRARS